MTGLDPFNNPDLNATMPDGMGLGWVVSLPRSGTPLLLGKSGCVGGLMTYVVLSPNRDLGVFVVANRVNFGMFNDTLGSNGAGMHSIAAVLFKRDDSSLSKRWSFEEGA